MIKHSFIKKTACILTIFIMTLSIAAAFGQTPGIEELEERKGVSPKEEFEIPFDQPIKASSITKWNVIVRDSKNHKVDTYRELGEDDMSIRIIPVEAYNKGETYTLYVNNTVRYKNNKSIGKNVIMRFTVAGLGEELPTVGTFENLRSILEKAVSSGNLQNGLYMMKGDFDTAVTVQESGSRAGDEGAAQDYSGTNVQVQGVDEADIIKTDGEFIYQVSGSSLIISKAYPVEQMQVINSINLDEYKLYPQELYLDEKHLVVIGIANNNIYTESNGSQTKDLRIRPHYMSGAVKLLVFDIEDKENIQKSREIELEGNYISSRKIDSRIYLISNKYIDFYRILNEKDVDGKPAYRDSALGNDFISIDYSDIKYFPDSLEANYMIAAGFDLENPLEGVSVSTFLGSGQSIYASRENLYVAVQKYKQSSGPIVYDSAVDTKVNVGTSYSEITEAYRFSINGSKLDYTGKSEVPGRILNQFSMDEYKGFFRIATTTGYIWGQGDDISKNNLYIVNSEMKLVGSIEDIAPGEKIYSVRFMGERAYMVTFKTVDPLFVIDLKDAQSPKILGALKIPGYSDYLHPYDENHIIGFGKDTVEVVHKDSYGNETGRSAYYLGMKLAIFDVTDVNNPVEMYVEKIGDRGTHSELLNNHKALMFSKEKNLLAFPVTLMEVKGSGFVENGMPEYGQFAFQGAYVYNIDLEEGFKLKGRITHLGDEDYIKQGMYWYGGDKNVNRIIYIDKNLYTVSNGMIKAHDIESMQELGSIELTK